MLSIILTIALTVLVWLLLTVLPRRYRAARFLLVAPISVGLLHLHSFYEMGYWEPFWPISVIIGIVVSGLAVATLESTSKHLPDMQLTGAFWKVSLLWLIIAVPTTTYLYKTAAEGISINRAIDRRLQIKAENMAALAFREEADVFADVDFETEYDRATQVYVIIISSEGKKLGTVKVDAVRFVILSVQVN